MEIPITVDDVIYSLKQVMDPLLLTRRASQVASEYITIKGAVDYCQQGNSNSVPWETVGLKKIDDYTLRKWRLSRFRYRERRQDTVLN
jgi:ABC-type oligopeptide transport system substrate-binding subunit